MKRRTFVKAGIGTVALVGAGSAGALVAGGKWGAGQHRLENLSFRSVEEQVRDYFPYLQIDAEGLRQFADVHRSQFGSGLFAKPDTQLHKRFLLSTDFFPNGADETRLVRYVTYYDPYVSPCWNPCATPAA